MGATQLPQAAVHGRERERPTLKQSAAAESLARAQLETFREEIAAKQHDPYQASARARARARAPCT